MKIVKSKGDQSNDRQLSSYTPVRSVFDDFFRTPSLIDEMFNRSVMPSYSSLSADVWEEGDNLFVKMALPGVKKEDINIEIDADTIRISGGAKKEESSDKDDKKYYFRSLDTQFEQAFNLPSMVNVDKAEASFQDGILNIKLPKADEYKPKKLEVKAG